MCCPGVCQMKRPTSAAAAVAVAWRDSCRASTAAADGVRGVHPRYSCEMRSFRIHRQLQRIPVVFSARSVTLSTTATPWCASRRLILARSSCYHTSIAAVMLLLHFASSGTSFRIEPKLDNKIRSSNNNNSGHSPPLLSVVAEVNIGWER
jgi:hypothetical protein